jgi:hypothetical protein
VTAQGPRRPLAATLALAAAALAVLATPAAAQPVDDLGADALWVWWWDDPAELADYVVDNGFDRVYLFTEGGFGPKARKTIAGLTGAGVAVEALGGEKRWGTDRRGELLRFVRSARRYDRGAGPGAGLAGIHVDVEPYGLRAWRRDERGTGLSLLHALAAGTRAARAQPFAADIPFWFDGIRLGNGRGSLARAIISGTDATTVMAYRDSGPAVIDVARQEIRMAGALGKTATVGVETGDTDPPQVTFIQEGRAALVEALAQIDAGFGARAGFGGTAVHHYGSLPELGP